MAHCFPLYRASPGMWCHLRFARCTLGCVTAPKPRCTELEDWLCWTARVTALEDVSCKAHSMLAVLALQLFCYQTLLQCLGGGLCPPMAVLSCCCWRMSCCVILCSAAPGVLSEKDQDIHRTCSSNFFGSLYQFSASIFNPYYIFIFVVTVTTAFPSLSITDSNSVDTQMYLPPWCTTMSLNP